MVANLKINAFSAANNLPKNFVKYFTSALNHPVYVCIIRVHTSPFCNFVLDAFRHQGFLKAVDKSCWMCRKNCAVAEQTTHWFKRHHDNTPGYNLTWNKRTCPTKKLPSAHQLNYKEKATSKSLYLSFVDKLFTG